MKAKLKIGDIVEVNPGKILFPPLVFQIENIKPQFGQDMVYGTYGGFPIHLVKISRKKL